jgi:excisionase family DNA binding protein
MSPTENRETAELSRLLGVKEVASWLGVSPAWVRSHANGNRRPALPSVKLGGALRFRRESVQAFIEKYSRNAA